MFLAFQGEQDLTLDEKSRLVLPAKFRAFVTDPEELKGFFIVADPSGRDRCLRMYTRAGYRDLSVTLHERAIKSKDPVGFQRIFAAYSEFAPMDSQSRFVVPQKLADFAGLHRDVVMMGVTDRLEIWDRQEWGARQERSRRELKDELAEALNPRKSGE